MQTQNSLSWKKNLLQEYLYTEVTSVAVYQCNLEKHLPTYLHCEPHCLIGISQLEIYFLGSLHVYSLKI